MSCVVFDIDGVLADNRHRLHYLQSGKPDWRTYNALAIQDTVVPAALNLHQALNKGVDVIFYVSGRLETMRADTLTWLRRHVDREIFSAQVFPHDARDSCHTSEFKLACMRSIDASPDGPVLLIIEDLEKNILPLQEAGFQVLQLVLR